jgi:hypothetical protein
MKKVIETILLLILSYVGLMAYIVIACVIREFLVR